MSTESTPEVPRSPQFGGLLGSAFIVVFDDEQGLCVPLGWDGECRGAICCNQGKVALFPDRNSARRAINISAKFAALRKSQGIPENTDFSPECRKSIRVMECMPNAQDEGQPEKGCRHAN